MNFMYPAAIVYLDRFSGMSRFRKSVNKLL